MKKLFMYKKSELIIDYYMAKRNLDMFRKNGETFKNNDSESELLKLRENIKEINIEIHDKIFGEFEYKDFEPIGYWLYNNLKKVTIYYLNLNILQAAYVNLEIMEFQPYLIEIDKLKECEKEIS